MYCTRVFKFFKRNFISHKIVLVRIERLRWVFSLILGLFLCRRQRPLGSLLGSIRLLKPDVSSLHQYIEHGLCHVLWGTVGSGILGNPSCFFFTQWVKVSIRTCTQHHVCQTSSRQHLRPPWRMTRVDSFHNNQIPSSWKDCKWSLRAWSKGFIFPLYAKES